MKTGLEGSMKSLGRPSPYLEEIFVLVHVRGRSRGVDRVYSGCVETKTHVAIYVRSAEPRGRLLKEKAGSGTNYAPLARHSPRVWALP
jgi:hypothetical protein